MFRILIVMKTFSSLVRKAVAVPQTQLQMHKKNNLCKQGGKMLVKPDFFLPLIMTKSEVWTYCGFFRCWRIVIVQLWNALRASLSLKHTLLLHFLSIFLNFRNFGWEMESFQRWKCSSALFMQDVRLPPFCALYCTARIRVTTALWFYYS